MYKEKLKNKICSKEDLNIECQEEYFYLLAQMLVYVFKKMGGADRYRREFSYLTCPTLPRDAKGLNKRAVHFLKNIHRVLDNVNPEIAEILDSLLKWNELNGDNQINLSSCETAFYDGIYEESILSGF